MGYIPDNEDVEISELARLAECFVRRMQMQERLCEQITDVIEQELKPKGVYFETNAKYKCMVARGI